MMENLGYTIKDLLDEPIPIKYALIGVLIAGIAVAVWELNKKRKRDGKN